MQSCSLCRGIGHNRRGCHYNNVCAGTEPTRLKNGAVREHLGIVIESLTVKGQRFEPLRTRVRAKATIKVRPHKAILEMARKAGYRPTPPIPKGTIGIVAAIQNPYHRDGRYVSVVWLAPEGHWSGLRALDVRPDQLTVIR